MSLPLQMAASSVERRDVSTIVCLNRFDKFKFDKQLSQSFQSVMTKYLHSELTFITAKSVA